MKTYVESPSRTLRPEVLKKFPNRIFIETGTGEGGGIQCALDCGFAVVFSIESNRETWAAACERFAGQKNVTILLGDSRLLLHSVLSALNEPATIFLDAHTASESPVDKELASIVISPFPHTVLIDDMRNFRADKWKLSPALLADFLAPLFTVTFENSPVAERDILCAVSKALP